MRKKCLAVIMTFCMLLLAVGCSKEGLSYLDETNKIAAWPAQQTEGTVKVSIQAGEEKVDVSLKMEGIVNTDAMQGEITMKDFAVTAAGQTMAFPDIQMYIQDNKVYFSKAYFDQIFALSGEKPSKAYQKITADYIGLETLGMPNVSMIEMQKVYMDWMKESNVQVPITKEGRKYSVNLTGDQLLDITEQVIVELIDKKDKLLPIFEDALTPEQIAELKVAADGAKEQLPALKEEAKKYVKDSKASMNYEFSDDKYTGTMDVTLKVDAMPEMPIVMNMQVTQTNKKVAKKDIKVPENAVAYTAEEFEKIIAPLQAIIDAENAIVTEKETLVPVKETMSQLGYTVKFDAKTKATIVVLDGKEQKIQVVLKKGKSYIKEAELQKLGFTVENYGEIIFVK